jgi:peptidoglycan/LPS O-acetylase OafA/YrhL
VVALILREGSAANDTPGFGRPAERLGYQPSLEGVRGLAVLLVLAVHLGQFVVPSTGNWFVPGGFIGVDIFFVLSGFLIGALLILELDRSRTINLVHFYVRRFIRIAPALWLFLVVHYLYIAWSVHGSLADERSVDIYGVTFLFNWRNSLGIGRISDMVHLWSVALEFQWYLVAPLIVWLLWRYVRTTARIVAVLVGASLLIAVVRYAEYRAWSDWNAVFERTDARFDTFLLGLLVAFLWQRGLLRASVVRVAGALGLAGILVMSFAAQAHKVQASPFLFKWGDTLIAASGAALVAVCMLPNSGIARFFDLVIMRVTGRISYSLYLWHLPVFLWVGAHLDWPAGLKMGAAVVLSFVFATGAYFIAEWPVLRSRPRALERVVTR